MFLAATALLVCGCLRVVSHEVPYYAKGPQQAEPPDGFLPAGKQVLVLGKQDSYRRVLTFDLIAGYVWEHDLVTPAQWRQQQRAEAAGKQELGTETQ